MPLLLPKWTFVAYQDDSKMRKNAAGTRQKSKLLKRAFSNLLFLTLSWSQIPIQIPAGFSNELILNRDNAKAEKREARVREEKKQEAEEEALNAEMIAVLAYFSTFCTRLQKGP